MIGDPCLLIRTHRVAWAVSIRDGPEIAFELDLAAFRIRDDAFLHDVRGGRRARLPVKEVRPGVRLRARYDRLIGICDA